MTPTIRNIERLFNVVDANVFMTTGTLDYPRIREASIKMLRLVDEYESPNMEAFELWSIGEYGDCHMDALIVALFWHSADYLDDGCTASCELNTAASAVFSPGMSGRPEADTSEEIAYRMLGHVATEYYNKRG